MKSGTKIFKFLIGLRRKINFPEFIPDLENCVMAPQNGVFQTPPGPLKHIAAACIPAVVGPADVVR